MKFILDYYDTTKMKCRFCIKYTYYDWDRLDIINYDLECLFCHRKGAKWFSASGGQHLFLNKPHKYLDINEIYLR